MIELYSCFICQKVMTDEETFKVIRDDDFGFRYFCRTCLNNGPRLSEGVILKLAKKD